MADDIVTRLRSYADDLGLDMIHETADEIERLTAALAAAMEVLDELVVRVPCAIDDDVCAEHGYVLRAPDDTCPHARAANLQASYRKDLP